MTDRCITDGVFSSVEGSTIINFYTKDGIKSSFSSNEIIKMNVGCIYYWPHFICEDGWSSCLSDFRAFLVCEYIGLESPFNN